jgi:hypothetical protein
VEFLLLIAVIAGLLAVYWVVQKLGGAALVGVDRAVFHGEYKEGKHLREGRTFRTSASVAEVMRELDTYVCAVDAPTGLSDVLYSYRRTDKGIAWVYGHGSTVLLEAIVAFEPSEGGTEAIFAVTRWFEEDGLLAALDSLKALRMQVEAAFRAADPAVVVTEGTVEADELTRYAAVFEAAN